MTKVPVTLPGYGTLTDDAVEALVMQSIYAWDNTTYGGSLGVPNNHNKFWKQGDPPPAKWGIVGNVDFNGSVTGWDTTPYAEQQYLADGTKVDITPTGQNAEIKQWYGLISQAGRSSYKTLEDWLNAIRRFLKTYSSALDGLGNPESSDFDILTWRQWGDKFQYDKIYPSTNGPGQNFNWIYLAQHEAAEYGAQPATQFPYFADWSKAGDTFKTDPQWSYIPPHIDVNGLGITQFLIWLLSKVGITADWAEIFAWEYTIILGAVLVAIIYTDFYPFFQAWGWVV